MKWLLQYRRKGDPTIIEERIELSFDTKKGVRTWFKSARKAKVGSRHTRDDYELINCKKEE